MLSIAFGTYLGITGKSLYNNFYYTYPVNKTGYKFLIKDSFL
tara:strand:- start:58 stop:183 length:126 start_codon:yes stop_codon:yes gene_type:complete